MTTPIALRRSRLPGAIAADAPTPVPISQPMPTVGAALRGLSVLIVEDDEDARNILVECLASNGARTFEAASAGIAFAILGAETIDVVVTDFAMPEEDGISMIRRARRELPVIDVPCIVLSGSAESDVANDVEGGPIQFFQKPADILEVVTAIAALARAAR